MRPAPALRLAVLAMLAASFVPQPSPTRAADVRPLELPTSSTPSIDAAATGRLRAAADAVRVNAGNDPLFRRQAYAEAAKNIATATVEGRAVPAPHDAAPYVHMSGTTTDLGYATAVDDAVSSAVRSMYGVLRYPMHTDGGWAVVTKRLIDGRIAYGVSLVAGWPPPPVSASRGCATGGYCWSTSGLHPHLPWTRNTVRWYLSSANLPADGEALVKAAISKLNAVSGFGAHLVYGGKTPVTEPTAARRFVIVWGSGCSTSDAIGCAISSTQGAYRLVFQAKVIMNVSRYRSNPSKTWWIGTLMHEIGHATGLGHYDRTYGGSYQLMRWANGPDTLRAGDGNGLRKLAPGGNVSGSLRPQFTGTAYRLVVRTANSGLGGIRAVRTQCTDETGAWRTAGAISGQYDSVPTDRVVGYFTPPAGGSSSCRAVIRSKTRTYTTARVTVRG